MALPPGWNSLEVAKMIVGVASPVVVFILGIRLQQGLRRIEQHQWANRQIIAKRLEIYEQTAPVLNDLLCFFLFVGDWKDLTPPAMLAAKRRLDKTMHLAAPLFTAEWLRRYKTFMHHCFQTFNQLGEDAKLRTTTDNRRPYSRTPWDPKWDVLFAPAESRADPASLLESYDDLMHTFATEMGLGDAHPHRLLARRPAAAPERPQDLLRTDATPMPP